jgi:hypothetical protein
MGDDEYERSEFQEVVSRKVGEVMTEHYSDIDVYDMIPLRMDAVCAIEGKDHLFSAEKYSGPTAAEDFFRDHPKFKELLNDSEIVALREDAIAERENEVENCWGVVWDRNELAWLMFKSVADEDDFEMDKQEVTAIVDAQKFCGVRHVADNPTIERQFDEKSKVISDRTRPGDMGIDTDVRYVGGEMKVSHNRRDVNLYQSVHYARSIILAGKKQDKAFMAKVMSGCHHIAESSGFNDRDQTNLLNTWMREFGIRESDITKVPSFLSASSSGCFIATAAYGTPFSEEIDVLRNWRDDFLEASYPGRLFIRTYYSLSPPVADNISESVGKRKIVRTALGPIVKVLKDRYLN